MPRVNEMVKVELKVNRAQEKVNELRRRAIYHKDQGRDPSEVPVHLSDLIEVWEELAR